MGNNHIEEIQALIFSLQADIITPKEYRDYVDVRFLEDPECELLMDLEFAANDLAETKILVGEYMYKTKHCLNYELLGHFLGRQMEKLYRRNEVTLEVFANRTYCLWNLLPGEIAEEQPLLALCSAGDLLPYEGESRTRKRFEDIFSYEWKLA